MQEDDGKIVKSSNASTSAAPAASRRKILYLFLDEAGNLDFSTKGTRYFAIAGVSVERPFPIDDSLNSLRFDLIEQGADIEYFHASEDRQAVRDQVFQIIQSRLVDFRVDSILVEKRKTALSFRDEVKFYPKILGCLIQYVLKYMKPTVAKVIIITDRLPINRKRKAVEKAIKQEISHRLPSLAYQIFHHDSKSCYGLQVADYFNWAIFRAWERNDWRSLNPVRTAVKSQFDIWATGTKIWY